MENGTFVETPPRQRLLDGSRMTMGALKDPFTDEGDNQRISEPPSVVSAAITEPTANASNSWSPCSQSHSSWDSSGYLRNNVQSSCFLCILRSEENEELEKKVQLLQKTRTTLEDAIAQLTEDGEVNAAQFETLSSLYHTDKESLQEQLKISDEIRKSLEVKYNQIDRENLSLRAQLEKADARVENLKNQNREMENEVAEYEALSAVSHTDRQDLHERISTLEVEKANWISSWTLVVREKDALERRMKLFEQGDRNHGSTMQNDLEKIHIPTASDFTVNTALLNRIMEEKDLLEGELYRIMKRNCELEAKQCELEKLLLSHQHESHEGTPENDADTISALTHEESPLQEARFKLLEEENSFLQRSLNLRGKVTGIRSKDGA
jgi:chromosome segregation ATPase